jgi:hypothetical protein
MGLKERLGTFVAERAGKVFSTRLAGAAAAEVAVATLNPGLSGWPSIAYILSEAALKGWNMYIVAEYYRDQ